MTNEPPVQPVIVGLKGTVVALQRKTGAELWRNPLRDGNDFVNVVIDRDCIFATTSGEIFCLEKDSGKTLWHNSLKGLGRGMVTIASAGSQATVMAEKLRRDQAPPVAAAT